MKQILFSILFLLSASAFANVSEQNVNPGINKHYTNTTFQEWVGIFERDDREVYNQRHAVVKELKLQASSDVADIGAGTGFYSLLFAKTVGATGNVFAVDITEDFVLNINRRAREQNLKNIHTVHSTDKDTLLAPNSIDLAFVCATYHHFEYPKTMLTSIYRALRTGGKLVIIDFRKQEGLSSDWVMSHVRSNKETVIKEIELTGFNFIKESNLLKSNYFLWFKKKPE